jgi:ribulose-phosphate 3-epimerase
MSGSPPLEVSASLWSADLGNLRRDLLDVEPYCDSFHFDIMDGHYVPNLLFGPDQVRALRGLSRKPFQLHLMVEGPERLVHLFLDCGDVFILHRETCRDWRDLAHALRSRGKQVGVALRVDEDWRDLLDDIVLVDLVLLMGTAIGVKGVGMAPGVLDTVAALKEQLAASGATRRLQADGGIRRETVPLLRAAGIDAVTAGSLLFGNDHAELRRWLRTL